MANYAESGETLKAFKLKKRWDKVMSLVKPGDYVFMQFGNNDMQSSGITACGPPTTTRKIGPTCIPMPIRIIRQS